MADQGQAIDVAVHVGSLGAVIVFFWHDVAMAARGALRLMRGRVDTQGRVSGALPGRRDGAGRPRRTRAQADRLDEAMRSTAVIGWTMIVFGLVALLGRPHRTDGAPGRAMDPAACGDHGPLAGSRADPRHLAVGHHHHRRAASRLRPLRRREALDADVDPDDLASGVLLGAEVVAEPTLALARDAAIAAAFAFVAALLALALMFRLLRRSASRPT